MTELRRLAATVAGTYQNKNVDARNRVLIFNLENLCFQILNSRDFYAGKDWNRTGTQNRRRQAFFSSARSPYVDRRRTLQSA